MLFQRPGRSIQDWGLASSESKYQELTSRSLALLRPACLASLYKSMSFSTTMGNGLGRIHASMERVHTSGVGVPVSNIPGIQHSHAVKGSGSPFAVACLPAEVVQIVLCR